MNPEIAEKITKLISELKEECWRNSEGELYNKMLDTIEEIDNVELLFNDKLLYYRFKRDLSFLYEGKANCEELYDTIDDLERSLMQDKPKFYDAIVQYKGGFYVRRTKDFSEIDNLILILYSNIFKIDFLDFELTKVLDIVPNADCGYVSYDMQGHVVEGYVFMKGDDI